jgi:hypothetical protein
MENNIRTSQKGRVPQAMKRLWNSPFILRLGCMLTLVVVTT